MRTGLSKSRFRRVVAALAAAALAFGVAPAPPSAGQAPLPSPTRVDLSVDLSPASVAEGDAAASVTVTASFPAGSGTLSSNVDVTVSVGKSGDTASSSADGSGADYTAVADFTVTIASGQSSGSAASPFTLTVTDDLLLEGAETLTITGTTAAAGINSVTDAAVTIADNDGAVTLAPDLPRVSEAAGAVSMTVTAALPAGVNAPAGGITVSVTMGDPGDAAASSADGAGADYTEASVPDILIAAGDNSGSSASFFLELTNDLLPEGDEAITVAGAATDTRISSVEPSSVTIADNDNVVTLSAPGVTAGIGEDSGTTTVSVTAGLPDSVLAPSGGITVSITVSDGTASSADYTATAPASSITIQAGQTGGDTASFNLTITDDAVAEGGETIAVTGTASSSSGIPFAVEEAALTIADNDDNVALSIDLSPAEAAEGTSTTVAVTASLDTGKTAAADTEVTVSVGKAGDTASSSADGAGADYTAVDDITVTIAAGQSSGQASFTLAATDDAVAEGSETLTVTGTAFGKATNEIAITITDGDAAPTAIDLSVSLSSNAVEGGTAPRVTVEAGFPDGSPGLTEDVTVLVAVGKSGDTAVSGTDYTALTPIGGAAIRIRAGQTSGSAAAFTLVITDDTDIEGDETITITGSTAASGITVNEAAVTIADDDNAVTLTPSAASVGEASGTTGMTVTAALPTGVTAPAGGLTVSITVGDPGDDATSSADGTGADYTAVTVAGITIAAGQNSAASASFDLTITNDDLAEGNQTITISGSAADPVAVESGSVTIDDDDDAVALSIDLDPAEVTEGGAPQTVAVTASLAQGKTAAAEATVTVKVGQTSDTANEETDYTTVEDLALTIQAGQASGSGSFTLEAADDGVTEVNETLSIIGSAFGADTNQVSITIIDNSANRIRLSVNPEEVKEGSGSSSITVTAAFPDGTSVPDGGITVTATVGKAGDSASSSADGSGADYTAAASFEIPITAAGNSSGSGSFTLAVTNDALVEGNETLTVTGAVTAAYVTATNAAGITGVSEAVITIVDDDNVVTLTVNPSSVAEDVSSPPAVSIEAALPAGVTAPSDITVSVTVGKAGDSASSSADGSGADYTAVTSVSDLTIASGTSSATSSSAFTLTPTDDDLAEGNETITITAAASGAGADPPDYTAPDAELTITDATDSTLTLSIDPAGVIEGIQDGASRSRNRLTRSSRTNIIYSYEAVTADVSLPSGVTAAGDTIIILNTSPKDSDTAVWEDDYITVVNTSAGLRITRWIAFIFEAGERSKTESFLLMVQDDSTHEPLEMFTVGVDSEFNNRLLPALASFLGISDEVGEDSEINPGFTGTGVGITISDNDLNPDDCDSDGAYIDDPSTNTELASDCKAMIEVRNHWYSDYRNYNLTENNPINNWGLGATAKLEDWDGVTVSSSGRRVTALELLNGRLTGASPSRISAYPGWEVDGALPAALGQLSALKHLYLNNNGFSGPIPAELWNLTNLERLYLNGNTLGSLGAAIGDLPAEAEADIADPVDGHSIDPEIFPPGAVEELPPAPDPAGGRPPNTPAPDPLEENSSVELILGDQPWDDPLSTEARQAAPGGEVRSRTIAQSPVALTGDIPAEIGNLTKLKYLRLSGNRPPRGTTSGLRGPIPAEIGDLTQLIWLDLGNNLLSGPLPNELGRLTKLEHLWIGDNFLSGGIPSSLGNLTKLITLYLNDNNLSGSVPSQLGNLAPSQGGSLQYLYIHNPRLQGALPAPLMDVEWIDLFSYDDPLGLISFYEFNRREGIANPNWQVYVCDVGGQVDITPQEAVNTLNQLMTPYFRSLSGGLYVPSFSVGSAQAVTSGITATRSTLNAAQANCLNKIKPPLPLSSTREARIQNSKIKVLIINNFAINNGVNSLRWSWHDTYPPAGLIVDTAVHVGGRTIKGLARYSTIAHEMGHDIQWPHSYSGRWVLLSNQVLEYDNRMDLMSGRSTYDLDIGTIAVNYYAAGWMDPSKVVIHEGGQKTYTLSPVGAGGTEMLAIPIDQGPGVYYTLGVRVREGLDGTVPQEGVEIYRVDQREYRCDVSILGTCTGASRRTQQLKLCQESSNPNLCRSLGPYYIEHVFDEEDAAVNLAVGTADRVEVEVVGRQGNRFTVRVGRLPFTPVTVRQLLGYPDRIDLGVNSSSVREGGGAARVTVTASFPSGSRAPKFDTRVRVSVGRAGDTAREGADYRTVDDFTVTIPAGDTSGSGAFDLRVTDDAAVESTESLTVSGSSPGLTVSGSRVIRITDNDREVSGGGNPGGNGGSGGGGSGGGSPPAGGGSPGGGGGGGGGSGGGGSGGPAAPPPAPAAPPAPTHIGRFSDEDTSVHQTNIETIASWGITVGCDSADLTLFCPGRTITRRQMAAFLYRAVSRWSTPAPATGVELTDVAADPEFNRYIDWAVANEVMAAPEGTFNPRGVVTRADMAQMLAAAFPYLSEAAGTSGRFADTEDLDPPVVLAVQILSRSGVTKGCSTEPSNYCPDRPVTRAQMASFFVRAINARPAQPPASAPPAAS